MNKDQKYSEYNPLNRHVGEIVQLEAKMHPVVVLLGPRGCGKSELLSSQAPFSSWKRVTLGDYDDLQLAASSPEALWREDDQLVVEEAQRSETLLTRIEQQTVSLKRKTRFVISCSERLPAVDRFIQELGGRAAVVELPPLSQSELLGTGPGGWMSRLLKGESLGQHDVVQSRAGSALDTEAVGYFPEVCALQSPAEAEAWYEDYVATFLERDLPRLTRVDSVLVFRRLMVTLAAAGGDIPNQSTLSRQLQISQPTVHRHLGLLERAGLMVRLPALTLPCAKRLVKSPKAFWVEPGLERHLARRAPGGRGDEQGFATLVMHQLRCAANLTVPRSDLYYWRTTTGKEVDFVVVRKDKMVGCAVPGPNRPVSEAVEHLRLFLAEYPGATAGVVITDQPRVELLGDRIYGLPWWLLS